MPVVNLVMGRIWSAGSSIQTWHVADAKRQLTQIACHTLSRWLGAVDYSTEKPWQWLKDQTLDHSIITALISGLTKWYINTARNTRGDGSLDQSTGPNWMGLLVRWMVGTAVASPPRTSMEGSKIPLVQQMVDFRTHKKLWNVAWDLWAHCNGILHNSSIV